MRFTTGCRAAAVGLGGRRGAEIVGRGLGVAAVEDPGDREHGDHDQGAADHGGGDPAALAPPAHELTWTITVRSRGRSSKSISTSCCQVPSARRPSITGTCSEGPISVARWWACELVSWLSRLCS